MNKTTYIWQRERDGSGPLVDAKTGAKVANVTAWDVQGYIADGFMEHEQDGPGLMMSLQSRNLVRTAGRIVIQ